MASTGLSCASPHHLGMGYLCAPGLDTDSSPLTSLAQRPWSGAGNWKQSPEVLRPERLVLVPKNKLCAHTSLMPMLTAAWHEQLWV